MKLRSFIYAIIICFIICIPNVYAESPVLDIDIHADLEGKLHININSFSELPVSIGVMNHSVDETLSETERISSVKNYLSDETKTEAEKLSKMVFFDQSSDSETEFVFAPKTMSEIEYYAVVADGVQTKIEPFTWYTNTSAYDFFDTFKLLTDTNAILVDLNNNSKLIDLYCGNYSGLSDSIKYKIANHFAGNMSNNFDSFINDMVWIKEALKIGQLNDSEISEQNNPLDGILSVMISSGQISEFDELNKYFSSTASTKATFARHLNDEYSVTRSGFVADFKDLWHRTKLELAENYVVVKNILVEYNNSCSLNVGTYFSINTKNIDTSIVGKYFSNKSSLENTITELISKNKNTSSGHLSGGDGGSRGGSSSMYITTEVNSQNTISKQKFNDVPKDFWGAEAIEVLTARGIVSGYPDGKFQPDRKITRAEFLKIALEAFSLVDSETDVLFDDIKTNAWYSKYVSSANKYNIVNGYEDNTFRPDNNIARQDAVCMLVRIASTKAMPLSQKKDYADFVDNNQISDYAYESVIKMYRVGIISGYSDNTFVPNGNLTRAEAVQMIFALMKETA